MIFEKESDIITYNGTNTKTNYHSIDLDNSREIGLHCGTLQTVDKLHYNFIYKLYLSNYNTYKINSDIPSIWSSIELAIIYLKDDTLIKTLRQHSNDIDKYYVYSKIYRQWFLQNGYNIIEYTNNVEDIGSKSYIILDTAVIDNFEQIR